MIAKILFFFLKLTPLFFVYFTPSRYRSWLFSAFALVGGSWVIPKFLVPIPNYPTCLHAIAVTLCQLVIGFGPYVTPVDPKLIAVSQSTQYSCHLPIALHLLPIGYYNSLLLWDAITRLYDDHHRGSLQW